MDEEEEGGCVRVGEGRIGAREGGQCAQVWSWVQVRVQRQSMRQRMRQKGTRACSEWRRGQCWCRRWAAQAAKEFSSTVQLVQRVVWTGSSSSVRSGQEVTENARLTQVNEDTQGHRDTRGDLERDSGACPNQRAPASANYGTLQHSPCIWLTMTRTRGSRTRPRPSVRLHEPTQF